MEKARQEFDIPLTKEHCRVLISTINTFCGERSNGDPMNSDQLLKIVQQYNRKNEDGCGDIKITRIPDHKTVFVEQIEGIGRAIMMDKYQVDEATYWAGYSSRSGTVYISLAA
jgi:hypothetical protein